MLAKLYTLFLYFLFIVPNDYSSLAILPILTYCIDVAIFIDTMSLDKILSIFFFRSVDFLILLVYNNHFVH